MGFYDFAVELKKQHKDAKDKTAAEVGYSIKYVPYILQQTALVYNKHHKMYNFNELLSVAFTASLEAEVRYTAEQYAFTTYARYYIEGALNAYVSNLSQTQLKLQNRIQEYIEIYFSKNKIFPARKLILQDLKISEESFRNLINSSSEISYIDDEESELVSNDAGPEDALALTDLHNAIDFIDVDYMGIIRMHLIDDLPFALIGKKLKITKAKVQSIYVKSLPVLCAEILARGLK